MMDQMKYRELEKRVEALELALVTMQRKGDVPDGMAPLTTLAAEMGLSTSKAEELARNCGVMIVRQGNGYLAHAGKFREAASLVIRGAKRKYGSKYWYHPTLGKFIMIKAAQA
ncbi:hypothetical protein SerAS12_4089 [Serratia sp. AS12]|uniref:hypothetical protein n=1 Tax=Serratia TaxID=613 RepID=UPI00020E9C26|nr:MULTISPECIES: hypothetical protein [Serratia]AEF47187.1 hypothetical protein SerAS9_4088 [Serratia plymuthica AS9]AEF52139.1 hypothetical protein SerAS12_4089 [Serratia sp. AS12]AEG29846.1 hypothetical protein SerAS13_4089 [Serratia sp. AS13]UTN95872.1 hypothetical protein NLX81_20800 [Serratia plymuthica]